MQNNKSITTYMDLLQFLSTMTLEQLKQEIMIVPPHFGEDSVCLEPVYYIGTIEYYFHEGDKILTQTHSTKDFKHHPEQVALLRDRAPYSKDGDWCWIQQEDGSLKGNVSGKIALNPFGDE